MTHLVLLIGASASGKSTLARKMAESRDCYTVKSLMTREQRPSDLLEEVDWCTNAEFRRRIHNNGLLEWEEFNDNYYGTTVSELKRACLFPLAVKVIDPRGAQSVIDYVSERQAAWDNVFIHVFHVYAFHEILVHRLEERGNSQSRIDGLVEEYDACSALHLKYAKSDFVNVVSIDGMKPSPTIEFKRVSKVKLS